MSLTILIIRHAEKPEDEKPELGPGLTPEGVADAHSLVIRGWQRAGAWAALFGAGLGGEAYPKPDAIYAANPDAVSPIPDVAVSRRPYETVLPLCARLALAPVATFGVGDEQALVDHLTTRSGTLLVCWEHKRIIEAILPALVAKQTPAGLPNHWNKHRFDVVLRFDRSAPAAPWQVRELAPLLLAGDSKDPVSMKD